MLDFNYATYISHLSEWATFYGLKILLAVTILLVGYYAAKFIKNLVRNALKKIHLDPMLISFITSLSHLLFMAFVMISALGHLGIETASFVAILGAAGLTIGLALQGSLSNFAAGILIVVFKPFKIDDYIEASGSEGRVSDIKIFTTELKTSDNKKIILPNASVMNNKIINHTAHQVRRIDISFELDEHYNVHDTKVLLNKLIEKAPHILKQPKPIVQIDQFTQKTTQWSLKVWTETQEYSQTKATINEHLKDQLDTVSLLS